MNNHLGGLLMCFMRMIAFYIYCSPLYYRNVLTSIEIDRGLASIKRKATNTIVSYDINNITNEDLEETLFICPDISYALEQGVDTLNAVGISTGIFDQTIGN